MKFKYIVIEKPFGVFECKIKGENKNKYLIELPFSKNVEYKVNKSALSNTPEEAKLKYFNSNLKKKKEAIEKLKEKLSKLENEYNKEFEALGISELIKKYPEEFI